MDAKTKYNVAMGVGIGAGLLWAGWNAWRATQAFRLSMAVKDSPELQAKFQASDTDLLLPKYSLRTSEDALADLRAGAVPEKPNLLNSVVPIVMIAALPAAVMLSIARNGVAAVVIPHALFATPYLVYRGTQAVLNRE